MQKTTGCCKATALVYHCIPFAQLPPANEVWGKVIFLHLSVILFTGEKYLCRYPRAGTPHWESTPRQVHCLGRYNLLGSYPPSRQPPRAGTPLGSTPPPQEVHPTQGRYTRGQVHSPQVHPTEQCMLSNLYCVIGVIVTDTFICKNYQT